MKTKKLFIISLIIFFGCLSNAFAECTALDVSQMRAKGFNDFDIMRICGNANPDNSPPMEVAPPPTNICQTPNMWCVLNQFGPAGAPCWCATPYGPVSGVLVPQR